MLKSMRWNMSFPSGLPWKMTKFNRKNTLFVSKFDFNLRRELVKCYILSIAMHDLDTSET
jgi:hypothetical protein